MNNIEDPIYAITNLKIVSDPIATISNTFTLTVFGDKASYIECEISQVIALAILRKLFVQVNDRYRAKDFRFSANNTEVRASVWLTIKHGIQTAIRENYPDLPGMKVSQAVKAIAEALIVES